MPRCSAPRRAACTRSAARSRTRLRRTSASTCWAPAGSRPHTAARSMRASSSASASRSRWAAGERRRTSPTRPCTSRPTRRATSPARCCQSTAGASSSPGPRSPHGCERAHLYRSPDRSEAQGLSRLVVRGRLDPPQLQDRRLAHDADARQRHRVRRRGSLPPPRSISHLGTRDREAPEPRGGRDHGQGLRAGEEDRRDGAVAPQGWRARRDTQQVRALRRSAVTLAPAPRAPRRVLFVTGKLAEPALRRVVGGMAPAFAWDVAVMRITVAALMTTPWIARFLEAPPFPDTDLVLIPGLCEGDPAVVAHKLGVPVEKGPKDLRQIPEYFGRAAATRDYGAYDIEIVAEVNNAPRLAREAIRLEAEHYRVSGADLIDIGCTPGRAFPDLAAVIGDLVAAGMRVSIDSLDPGEIGTAVQAGAELVLSVNGSNIEVARDLDVGAVHAQHELGSGLHGGTDLAGVERVDAHPHPGRDQVANHGGQVGKCAPGGAADVDQIGAAYAVMLRLEADRFPREPRRVVHLGDDLDVVRPVVACRRGAPEVLGDLPQVLGALLHRHTELLRDHGRIALAQAGDQNEVRVGERGGLEEARDPRCGHECGHRDAHDHHVPGERGRHSGDHAAQRGLRELPGDEQDAARGARRRRHRGSPARTNLLGVPSRAPPLGRHSTVSSILRASSKSLSVIPPAAWFWSFTITRPQVTDRSG